MGAICIFRLGLPQSRVASGIAGMTSLRHTIVASNLRRARIFANAVIHALASIKVAVSLIVLLAVVISAATILETKHGRPYSQWFVYHSSWFVGVLGLVAASVFCAAY